MQKLRMFFITYKDTHFLAETAQLAHGHPRFAIAAAS